MKRVNSLLLAVILLALFTGVVSCGDDSPPAVDPVAAAKEKISKTWGVEGTSGKVIFDNVDRTTDYTDFALTVKSDNTYTTTEVEALDPWPNSGTWSFTDETKITDPNASSFQVTRDDGLVMTATFTDEGETLTLNFLYDQNTHDGERTAQVDGNWTFVLTAQ